MTLWNEKLVERADELGVPGEVIVDGDDDNLLQKVADAEFWAEDEVTKAAVLAIRCLRAEGRFKEAGGAVELAKALKIDVPKHMGWPFKLDALQRPLGVARDFPMDGYGWGRGECDVSVNYAVVPGTGLGYVEGYMCCGDPITLEADVYPLDDLADAAANVLYGGYESVMMAEPPCDCGECSDPEDMDADGLDQVVERLRRDVKADVAAEVARC